VVVYLPLPPPQGGSMMEIRLRDEDEEGRRASLRKLSDKEFIVAGKMLANLVDPKTREAAKSILSRNAISLAGDGLPSSVASFLQITIAAITPLVRFRPSSIAVRHFEQFVLKSPQELAAEVGVERIHFSTRRDNLF
jgi:hypothetical protein